MKWVLGLILIGFATLSSTLAQPTPTPGEGLYDPDSVSLTLQIEEATKGVVRATSNVRFQLTVFASPDSAAKARSAPAARKKIPTDRGTLWPVLTDSSTTSSLCSSSLTAAQTGFHVICQTLDRSPCQEFPCTRMTSPLEGTATGFFVGRRSDESALIATNYHVAREAIERHNRTSGTDSLRTASAAPDLSISVSQNGRHTAGSYKPVSGTSLLANASEGNWQSGEDWALLQIPASEVPPSAQMLQLSNNPPAPGDTLYALGFPIRTIRDLPADAPYRNAENDLRVSVGVVVEGDSVARAKSKSSDLLVRMDAVSGNSGSPVLDRRGKVVGILRHHTHRKGEIDLNVGSYGGLAQVVPIRFFKSVVRRARAE
jgi:S1-C subfamily serine protease